MLARACLPAGICAPPIRGGSGTFGWSEEQIEEGHRRRRDRMSPTRRRSTGHTAPAAQIDAFLRAEAPSLPPRIHGEFIDMDVSPGTGALTQDCDGMRPPILGAAHPCVFVHGDVNQQAQAYNRGDERVGGRTRAAWRTDSVAVFTHEVQHVLFDDARTTGLPGRACSRTTPAILRGRPNPDGRTVNDELSELNAILSEFPVYHAASRGRR